MKKHFLLVSFLIFTAANGFGQYFYLKGLEIYNPVYDNPAFIAPDDKIQVDLIAYDFAYQKGYWTNVAVKLPNTKSSVGIAIGGGKMFNSYSSSGTIEKEINSRSLSLDLNYGYTHSFSDELKLSGGGRLKQSMLNVYDTVTNLKSRYSTALFSGMNFEFRKLYAGLSLGSGIFSRDIRINETDETETTWSSVRTFESDFIAGYNIGGERRVNIDPVIGFQYHKSFKNDFSEFALYAGGNITIVKTFGIGFTLGDMVSLSTNLSIHDRFNIYAGIFQGGALFDKTRIGGFSADYSLGFDPLKFIIQLRVKL